MAFKIQTLDEVSKKYKIIIWAGTRSSQLENLDEPLYPGSSTTHRKEILNARTSPALIVWETHRGERKYAEVNEGTE